MNPNIYSWVTREEAKFQTEEIQLGDNWSWNFRNHVQLIFHLVNGVFYTGLNNWLRAFKNIIEPILNLSFWSEDIEVKDVLFYIENETGRVLSFLINKFYEEVYVKENDLDTLFDEITESDLTYGGVLVQKTNKGRPEVLPFNSVAFCDQTDILGGPIAFKFNFAPDKLREMSKFGWGDEKKGATISIEDLIIQARSEKAPAGTLQTKRNETTGKNIEVYVVRGNMPEHYLSDNNDMDYFCNQVQIIAYYRDEKDNKLGVTLYRQKETEGGLKFFTSKKVHGRALGRGVGEGMIHPQLWTNFLTIHKMNFLEAASKVPLYTDDASFMSRNKVQDMDNLEVTTIEKGSSIGQIPTASPLNVQLFTNAVNEWYEHGQLTGAAFDPLLGKEASSGTTFRGQERTIAQGRGIHDRRRGQRAKFLEEIHRDWIIPDIKKAILGGKKFLATLTSDELQWVSEQLADNYANRAQLDDILTGKIPRDAEALKQEFLLDFSKKGNKHILEILSGEFEDVEVKMGINIAGKQKDLVGLSDKILSIFQFVFSNPAGFQQAMQIPGMSKSFNEILEFGGISPVDFASVMKTPISPTGTEMQGTQTPSPVQKLQLNAPVAS